MIKELLAIRMRRAFFRFVAGKDKNGNPKKLSTGAIIGFTALYTFLFFIFVAFVFSIALPLAFVLVGNGAESLYYGLFTLISLTVIFILSIFETKSELFECRDNELLLSMPIKPMDIVVSRIATVLIYNYITEFIVIVPVIICSVLASGSALGIIGSIITFLTLPPLATALASGVGYVVALFSAKLSRFKNLAIIILTVGFLGAYFFFINYFTENIEGIITYIEGNISVIADRFSFVGFIGEASLLSPLPTLVYLVVCVAVSAAAVILISKSYIGIITKSAGAKKKSFKGERLSESSPFSAVVKKEFYRFTSSATYMLNGGLGLLFALFVGGFTAFKRGLLIDFDPEFFAELEISASAGKELFIPFVVGALIFCLSMTMMSCSAVSLEGRNHWIIKSMPISAKTILLAKLVPSILLTCATSVIAGLAAAIFSGVSFIYFILYPIVPAVASVAFSMIGLVFNCLFPKLEFNNEAEVIKQSLASFLTMIVNMLLSMASFFVLAVGAILGAGDIALIIVLGFFLLICVGLYFLIAGPMANKYAKL